MLESKGYTIITRRHCVKGGEIDVVAMDGQTLVFVEVRYRKHGLPEESLSVLKAKRFFAAAEAYRTSNGLDTHPFRFDLVLIDPSGARHYTDVSR